MHNVYQGTGLGFQMLEFCDPVKSAGRYLIQARFERVNCRLERPTTNGLRTAMVRNLFGGTAYQTNRIQNTLERSA